MKKAKGGRKCKYKTEKERKAAQVEAQIRYWAKRNTVSVSKPPPPPETLPPSIEKRLAALEQENKDILLDLEECLKEIKHFKDFQRWGKR